MLFARADWLVRKWLASTIHLWAAEETKSRVKSLISDHFSVNWTEKMNYFFGICGVYTKTIIYFSVVNNCWRHRRTDLKSLYFEVNSVLSKLPFIKLPYSIKLPVKLQLQVLSAYWLKNLTSIWTCSWSFLACQLHSFYKFAPLLHENWTFLQLCYCTGSQTPYAK